MEDLLESYFNKENIELNLEKFPSETNILYITGLSGSGKSTEAEDYAKKYKDAVCIPLDMFFYVGRHTKEFILNDFKNDPINNNSEIGIYIINFMKKLDNKYFDFAIKGNFNNEAVKHMSEAAFLFIKDMEKDKDKFKFPIIIEGIQIFLTDPEFYKDKPIIINGSGVFKSNLRAIRREFEDKNRTFGDKIRTLLDRTFGAFASSFRYDSKSIDEFRKGLNEDVSKSIEKRSYETAKQEAVSAVVSSRLRHMADNEYKETRDIAVKIKLKRLRNELAKEKVDHLISLVIAADTTNDRVSVDIHDDAGNKSVIADFDGKTHMGLHTPKGQHNILNQDRVGRRRTTNYGENDKFIKNVTGKDLPELLDTEYKDMKHRIGLTEAHRDDPEVVELTSEIKDDVKRLNDLGINVSVNNLDESEFSDDLKAMYGRNGFDMDENIDETLLFEDIMLLDEGRRYDYYKYVREHTNNVKKAYRWMKKYIPEIFLNWKQKVKTDFTIMKHDLSKWQRKEFEPYSKHFKGTEKEKEESQEAFQRAWNHHQKVNKHHWQYWVLVDKDGHNQALDMPFENIVEMIADWWSFSWKTGKLEEIFGWYAANKSKMILSAKTASTVEMILNKIKTKLHQLENEKKLKESLDEYMSLDEDLSNPYEELEEDFYDDMPLDEETYLFCEDCERRLEKELNENMRVTKEQAQYAEYLTQHITNVKRGYFWIKENAPEILEGCDKEKVEANLIVHDESKYSNEEYDAYSKFFYGERTPAVRRAFRAACMHHFMNNPHHPEWWMGVDMSQEALVEALCDWWSFSWKDNNMSDIFDFWKKARKHKFGSDMTENSKDRMQVLIEKLYKALDRANML